MAKAELSPLLQKLSGKVGNLVFRRVGDDTIVSGAPNFDGHEPSEAQLAARDRFRRSVQYGKAVMADDEALAPYEEAAAEPGAKPLFSIITADYLNSPTVDEIDLTSYNGAVDDEIIIHARDDFEVVSVDVSIHDSDGKPIEDGPADKNPDGHWSYRTSSTVAATSVSITATATDRPGGTGHMQKEKQL